MKAEPTIRKQHNTKRSNGGSAMRKNTESQSVPRQAVRLPELAHRLSISERKAWTLVTAGAIRSVRAGHSILIPLSAIDDFLSQGKE